MFDHDTRKGRILAAALELRRQEELGQGDPARHRRGRKPAALGAARRLHQQERHHRRPAARRRRRGPQASAPSAARARRSATLLFDIVMTRFDVLGPYKAALEIDLRLGPGRLRAGRPLPLLPALDAARPPASARKARREPCAWRASASTYASVFRVWLEDEDPGLARTMAALDRRLRRGERALGGIEQLHTAVSRFGEALQELARNATRGPGKPGPSPGPEAGQV